MDDAGELWRRVASSTGAGYAERYAARFDAIAATGHDVHGEASFVACLVPPGGSVLDAGSGTGRVAVRLHELGYRVTGVDIDPAMVAVARERAPELTWHVADLGALQLPERFDVVVAAGNVVPLVGADAVPAVVSRLARQVRAGGLLVAGFGLDSAHLPPGAPVVPLAAYDEACASAGLLLESRHAGWDGAPCDEGGGYAVSVHRAHVEASSLTDSP
jgi:SAM-dependent methyltransferase